MSITEILRNYLLWPFQLLFKLFYIIMMSITAGLIITVIKWLYPITQRKFESMNDLKNKRNAERQHHHESIIIASDENFTDIEDTFTLNVSVTGCLALTNNPRSEGDNVWVKIGNADEAIPGVIRRLLTTNDNKVIGVGIQYITEYNNDMPVA